MADISVSDTSNAESHYLLSAIESLLIIKPDCVFQGSLKRVAFLGQCFSSLLASAPMKQSLVMTLIVDMILEQGFRIFSPKKQ